jgi:hypothetical protein
MKGLVSTIDIRPQIPGSMVRNLEIAEKMLKDIYSLELEQQPTEGRHE